MAREWMIALAMSLLATEAQPLPAAAQPAPGPALSCGDFTHNADGTWSSTHPVLVTNGAATSTIWPTTHFGKGVFIAGFDPGVQLDQQCGANGGAPPPQPNPPQSPNPPQPNLPQQTQPPPVQQGPKLDCASFTRNADGTWSSTKPVRITNGAATSTIWPTTHLSSVVIVAGLSPANLLDLQCGGPAPPQPPVQQNPPPQPQPPPPPPPIQTQQGAAGTLPTGVYECFNDGEYTDDDLRITGPGTYSWAGAAGTYQMQPSGQIVFPSGPLQAYHSKLLPGGNIGLNTNGDSFYQTDCELNRNKP